MSEMFWIWVAVCVLAIIFEIVTPALVSVWFVAGGVVALIMSCFEGVAWYWQLIAFLVVSLLCLFVLRPLAMKASERRQTEANAERLEKKTVRLKTAITEDGYGEVVINGVTWNARSRDGQPIDAGETVEIVAIDGNKVVVSKK